MHTFKEYADLIKKEHALNKTIAPNETGTTASKAYAVGDHFIRNGILYKVTTAIASGATWANISSSYTTENDVSSSIQNLSNLRAELGAHNLFNFDAWVDFILANSSALIRGTMTKSGNSVTLTATANDCYTRHGNSTYYATKALIPVKAGQKYTFEWETDSTTSEGVVHVFTYDSSFTQKSDNTANDTVKKISITVPTDAVWLEIRVGVNTSGNSITYSNFVVRRTEDVSGYQPYTKTNKELTEDVAKLTIKTATFSANTGTNGIVASGIPEAKAPKCIPISVSFTSSAPPPCVGFEYNNSYGAWYIRCKSWDGSLRQDSDVAGTIRYLDLN